MKQRIFIKHLSPQEQEKIIKEEEASLDTHTITGKDQGKIATLAYALYEQRGRENGYDLDDWLEAEQRLEKPIEVLGGFRTESVLIGLSEESAKESD